MSGKLFGWLTINQMLFISHLILVLSLVMGMSYSRYQSEWRSSVEHMAELSKSHFASHSTFLSVSVAGRNYANLLMRSTIDNLKAIPGLKFVEITGVSDYLNQELGVRYDLKQDLSWRIDVSPEEIKRHQNQATALKTKLLATSPDNEIALKKFTYLANKADVDLAALKNSIDLQLQVKLPTKPRSLSATGYYLDEAQALLHIQLPLRNNNGGELWAVIDASKLSHIKDQLLLELLKEALVAMFISIILIYIVTIWLVSPLKELSVSMKEDIETIDQATLPCIERSDEVGDLARAYSSLITRLKNQLQVLHTQTETDPLTGLGSRFKYKKYATQLILNSLQQEKYVFVMVCDIDNFKLFNDTYGHTEGDNALVSVASALLTQVKSPELACRIGGEEFVLILTGKDYTRLQQRIIQIHQSIVDLAIPHTENTPYNILTLSAGAEPIRLSNKTPDLDDCQQSLKHSFIAADNILYKAKEAGRNQVQFSATNSKN